MAAGNVLASGRPVCHINAAGQHVKSFQLQRHAANHRAHSGLNASRKAELAKETATARCRWVPDMIIDSNELQLRNMLYLD